MIKLLKIFKLSTTKVVIASIIVLIYAFKESIFGLKIGSSASYSIFGLTEGVQHGQIAERLWNATKQMGTDESAVIGLLRGQLSKDDLILIYNKFGTKKYFKLAGEQSAFLGTKLDLITILQNEFQKDSEDYQILEQIWTKTGLW